MFFITIGLAGQVSAFLLNRLSCTVFDPKKRRKKNYMDTELGVTIMLNVMAILGMILGNKTGFLSISKSKLMVALVGAVIMLASEIAIRVLRGKFCREIRPRQVNNIVCGDYANE